jgi:hypothetical protein
LKREKNSFSFSPRVDYFPIFSPRLLIFSFHPPPSSLVQLPSSFSSREGVFKSRGRQGVAVGWGESMQNKKINNVQKRRKAKTKGKELFSK